MPHPRITFNPDQMCGVPCIRGLRIPVVTVLRMLADAMTADDILALYPDLEREDIAACLLFAADTVAQTHDPVGHIIAAAKQSSGLSEDEAMALAVEETRAHRLERQSRPK